MPPTKQQVYTVQRTYDYPEPGLDAVKLVAALRQKYGPETKAIYPTDNGPYSSGDANITAMYWVYDEQGHFIASDKGASRPAEAPFDCEPMGEINNWGNMFNRSRLNTLAPSSVCDNLVVLSVSMGATMPAPYRRHTITEIEDHALLRRDVQIAGDAAKADAQKKQQQQFDKSKQAVPTL